MLSPSNVLIHIVNIYLIFIYTVFRDGEILFSFFLKNIPSISDNFMLYLSFLLCTVYYENITIHFIYNILEVFNLCYRYPIYNIYPHTLNDNSTNFNFNFFLPELSIFDHLIYKVDSQCIYTMSLRFNHNI